jgi:hypothetical protein
MLLVGQGVYRDIFENLQLVTLINWRYGFGNGSVDLQYTNLAAVSNNSFPATFGGQFIVIMCILGLFWLLLILIKCNKLPHAPTAKFAWKNRVTISTRVITLIFNMLLFASMMQVTTTGTEPYFKTFAVVLAALALAKIVFVIVGLAITSNWEGFCADDPDYYVLL